MRGDFSSFWNKEEKQNFNGVLHQQGRVLLDRDWNTQTEILNDWQETAAQDIIGAGVAAVPAEAKDSFKVTRARFTTTPAEVKVSVNKGRVWADGLLIELNENVDREATYLQPPIQKKAQIPPVSVNNPVRDAVILEAWHEELSAFQEPRLLLEPALGGVDTTERMQTAFRFRLYRMEPEDTCDSIIKNLKDKFGQKGKLTVTLQPDTSIIEDCPVVSDGGYTGFEHRLYRVEIADTDRANQAWFKWSQFNGGLVGRGTFDSANRVVKIEANSNAINHSGLSSFYLETLEFDPQQGFRLVTFGAKVTLDAGTNTLKLPQNSADVFYGAIGSMDAKKVFFRLWNDIRRIDEFRPNEKELQDGVFLKFDDAPVVGNYVPHDFWTFQVRADDIENNQVEIVNNKPTLINSQSPQGIFYHRVPLAELNWRGSDISVETQVVEGAEDIEDCRRIFQPLTKLSGCCTYRVGDGVTSYGDFTRIQDAINNLPREGGQICVLPGIYRENIVIAPPGNRSISIKGCGKRSHIIVNNGKPAIHIKGGTNLNIESLKITAGIDSPGILLEGDAILAEDNPKNPKLLRNVSLEKLDIGTVAGCAIEMHVGQFVSIRNCRISVKDFDEEWRKLVSAGKVDKKWAGVYLAGDDLLFEGNEIRVLNKAEVGDFAININDLRRREPAKRATGGLHLGGGGERVRVIDNLIIGGTGNGINLGSVDLMRSSGIFNLDGESRNVEGRAVNAGDRAVNIGRAVNVVGTQGGVNFTTVVQHEPWGKEEKDEFPNKGYIENKSSALRLIAGAPLRDIWIEDNRIFSTGRNGIGVDAFFGKNDFSGTNNLPEDIEFISVENLFILNNRIEFCLNRPTPLIPDTMTALMGYGGIALSAVENLTVRDNFISDNGIDHSEPVCGIYLRYGEGIEILRNRILNNGKLVKENVGRKPGFRGGIIIMLGLPAAAVNTEPVTENFFPNGIPALKLHENIVSVPEGPTLILLANGQVSVVGNQFLRQSLSGNIPLWEFFGANVLIGNLSVSANYYEATMSFDSIAGSGYRVRQTPLNTNVPTRRLLGGSTVFAYNQCQLISRMPVEMSAVASVLILSLDDISFLGNDVNLALKNTRILVNTILLGASVRANDNRWQEPFEDLRNQNPIESLRKSALTLGIMNTTTDNHSTHCLKVIGRLFIDRYNLTFPNLIDFINNPGWSGDLIELDRSGDYLNPCKPRRWIPPS